MQVLQHLRPRLILYRRAIMWVVVGLFLVTGIFAKSAALAETAACPGQSSIPITPVTLFLKYGGPVSTYEVSLCEDPDPGTEVQIATTPAPAGKVTLSPANFSLDSTTPQTVSVGIAAGHPVAEPFTVVVTHTATSDDPDFDWGTLNIPRVTAYYSPPVAITDTVATVHGQSLAIDVLENDIDRLGQGLTLSTTAIITAPAAGAASVNVTQTIQYTPATGFSGSDSFTYRVEDVVGNTDIGTAIVTVVPANVQDPQVAVVDPFEESEVVFGLTFGDVTIKVPPLVGFPPGSQLILTLGEVITPTGNIDAPPGNVGTFSGISFYFVGTVNGVPIDEENLTGPITITITLPDTLVEELDGTRIILAVWDGTAWSTEGIEVISTPDAPAQIANAPDATNDGTLTFNTTVFGEIGIFVVRDLYLPSLARD